MEEKQLNKLLHMVGLDKKKPYKRYGKLYYVPYRNYYDAGEEDIKLLLPLVSQGILCRNENLFSLTLYGLKILSEEIEIHIYSYFSDSLYDTKKEILKYLCSHDVYCGYGCWIPISRRELQETLRLPEGILKKSINSLKREELIKDSYYGGCSEDGIPYCYRGLACTEKSRKTKEWEHAYEREQIRFKEVFA